MPLLHQHSDAEATREFMNLYAEIDQLRSRVVEVEPSRAALPAVNEKSATMPYFVHEINFVKTDTVGADVYDFQQWPVALIAGPYMLRALELRVFQQDAVNSDHLVNARFQLRQMAPKREWDISANETGYDHKPKVFAQWEWGDTSLTMTVDWDMPVNASEGDTIMLQFGSRLTPEAPSGTEWSYKALILGHYIPYGDVLFAKGVEI